MKAMILAAGRGERLRPLTDHIPKPLAEVAGKPLIIYHIERLAALGVKHIVINHAWLGHKLEQALGDGRRWQLTISYSRELEALETGGGIKKALPLLGTEPFLVINGDVFIDAPPTINGKPLSLTAIEKAMMNRQAYLWLVDNPPQHPHGDFGLNGDQVELTTEPRLTFSGIAVYRPAFFDSSPDGRFGLAPLLKQKMALDLVAGERFPGYWCDVGTLDRLAQLNDRIAATANK
ncbi:N-acetylmuramate alpha-1-phosphate uridylyltransferase MurU [Shewanella psychrotolerans]|uniref:N-acetylmuramate alpha-1-phosphate uridylyltransferase MurU n=1 Tax=Shewanella psychrotolerans TaxID=2864206 RepID=UPI001C65DCD0|nr:nucleotidyltransferase family protein [Shewanella psychrotolerans]QYK02168.1 nucleotidyltransferase family protein [Shewanella psychrotolerans]